MNYFRYFKKDSGLIDTKIEIEWCKTSLIFCDNEENKYNTLINKCLINEDIDCSEYIENFNKELKSVQNYRISKVNKLKELYNIKKILES